MVQLVTWTPLGPQAEVPVVITAPRAYLEKKAND